MAETAELPLVATRDFQPGVEAGQVNRLIPEMGRLLADVVLAGKTSLAVVPAYEMRPEDVEILPDGTRIIHRARLVCFGLTAQPADPHCRLLKLIENGGDNAQ